MIKGNIQHKPFQTRFVQAVTFWEPIWAPLEGFSSQVLAAMPTSLPMRWTLEEEDQDTSSEETPIEESDDENSGDDDDTEDEDDDDRAPKAKGKAKPKAKPKGTPKGTKGGRKKVNKKDAKNKGKKEAKTSKTKASRTSKKGDTQVFRYKTWRAVPDSLSKLNTVMQKPEFNSLNQWRRWYIL